MYTRSGKLLAAASAWAVVAAWPVLAQAAPVTLPGALSPQSSVAPAAPALPQPAAPAQATAAPAMPTPPHPPRPRPLPAPR